MSYFTLLAADRPMPELQYQATRPVTLRSGRVSHEICASLFILPHGFDLLRCHCDTQKTCYSFFNYDSSALVLQALKNYCNENLADGESVELWGIWEGEYPNEQGELVFVEDYARANQTPIRRTVTLEQLSLEDLSLLEGSMQEEQSVCITVRREVSTTN